MKQEWAKRNSEVGEKVRESVRQPEKHVTNGFLEEYLAKRIQTARVLRLYTTNFKLTKSTESPAASAGKPKKSSRMPLLWAPAGI